MRDQVLASMGWRIVRIRNADITEILLGILARRLPNS